VLPSRSQIEYASPERMSICGDVVVLAPLGLLQAQREVTVVLGAAEVRELDED